MEFLLGGLVAIAAAAFFLLVGAYFGRLAAIEERGRAQQPHEPAEEEPPFEEEEPLSEEEQNELAERLSRIAAQMASGIAQNLGAQVIDFSQVFVGQWPPAEEAPQEKEAEEKEPEKQQEPEK